MIETELKAMLTSKQYDTVLNMFPWDVSKPQTNHYYTDKKGELKKNGITFRVRTIDDKHIIQVKKHINSNSPLQVCEENEFSVTNIPKGFTSSEIEKMTGIAAETSHIGDLVTLRKSYMYCDGVEICLDKNDFLDITDYEIEIEYTTQIPQDLLNKLSMVGITFEAPSKGKFSRFMTRLIEIIS